MRGVADTTTLAWSKDTQDLKTRSQEVRNDTTGAQQRLLTKRQGNVVETNQSRQGADPKEYQELAKVIKLAFGHGSEIHPRLAESTRYRAPDCAMLMRQAKELILSVAPPNSSISLSTCYTYMQNFKAGTNQAKRHHSKCRCFTAQTAKNWCSSCQSTLQFSQCIILHNKTPIPSVTY